MKILAFGIVKDIFDNSMIDVDLKTTQRLEALKAGMEEKYPQLSQLGSYMIAVNNEYASADDADIMKTMKWQ